MLTGNLARLVLLATSFCFTVGVTHAQDAVVRPNVPLKKTIGVVTPTGPVPSLAVINSAGATLDNDKLTLTDVSANAIVFADRPVRAAGHLTTEQFIMQWDEGKNNFAKDPPNATVSVLSGDGSNVSDAVVTLKSPRLQGKNLTFEVSILEGSLNGSSGPAAVFIDDFGNGGRSATSRASSGTARVGEDGSAYASHGKTYWHAPIYHGAWYASSLPSIGAEAALGAAAERPDYGEPCVDSPYQVCY
jgi:hypothetical protein